MKALVVVVTIVIGVLLVIYLLDYTQIWTIFVFTIVCYGMGYGTYWVLRKIDKRYPK